MKNSKQNCRFDCDYCELVDTDCSLYQSAFDLAPLGMALTGVDGVLRSVNRAFADMLGYSREDLSAKTFLEITKPSDQDKSVDKVKQILAGEEDVIRLEKTYIHSDGHDVHSLVTANLVRDRQGKPTHFITCIQDISRTRERQARLEFHASLLDIIEDAVIATDRSWKVMVWNRAAEKLYGFTASEMIGRSLREMGISRYPQKEREEIIDSSNDNGTWRGEVVHYRKDGTPRTIMVALGLMGDEAGVSKGAVAVNRDVTDLRQLETDRLQGQKMEAIGQLAAGVAHEINTPAQYVGDNLKYLKNVCDELRPALTGLLDLQKSLSDDLSFSDVIERLNEIVDTDLIEELMEETPLALKQTMEGVERIATIVQAMKQFTHPGSGSKTGTDINSALETTLTISRNTWKYHADVETDFSRDLPLVVCDGGEINQVLLNIIVNAAQAIDERHKSMPEEWRGTIRVATRQSENEVTIDISDTGGGIPEDIVERIFDPFFTTKEVGQGTGQGLSIAHSIVEKKHGGRLQVQSVLGEGATFSIRLPIQ